MTNPKMCRHDRVRFAGMETDIDEPHDSINRNHWYYECQDCGIMLVAGIAK